MILIDTIETEGSAIAFMIAIVAAGWERWNRRGDLRGVPVLAIISLRRVNRLAG